jgi:hypothetical protein
LFIGTGVCCGLVLASTPTVVAASPRSAPPIEKQLAELKGSDTVAGDGFGGSVAISGTTAVVGAPDSRGYGRVYVFTKASTGWKQTAELKAADTVASEQFGRLVAISGSTIIVAANGPRSADRVYIFTKSTGLSWRQAAELKGPDTDYDGFGSSVAVSGTTVVVGDDWKGSGHVYSRVYIFTKTSSGWKNAVELNGNGASLGSGFGSSVAISGGTVAVGAPFDGSKQVGLAYVFTKTGTSWDQAAALRNSDTVPYDIFGLSVAVSGNTVVVGTGTTGPRGIRVYVFAKTTSGWDQVAELKGPGSFSDLFGLAFAISGSTIVVGAPSPANARRGAYLFTRSGSGWKLEEKLYVSGAVSFGSSVAISANTVLVGADAQANWTGRAYVFAA